MGFVSSILNPSSGAGFQAVNADTKIGPANDQVQAQIKQQQDFVNALNAQGGLGNQSNVFNQQQALANQLQGVANGTGPNPALAQLNQATGQNAANQAALMASQRGSGANAGMLARLAAQQGGALQQQASAQGATLQAQQQLAGMQQLQNQQASMGNLANTQVAQQQGGLNALTNAGLQNQSNIMGLQANANSANANVAGANAQAQASGLGGLLGGAGMGAMMAGGGGGAASAAPLAAAALSKGGTVPGYAGGGFSGNPLMQPVAQNQVTDLSQGPQSAVGKMLNGAANQSLGQMGGSSELGKGANQFGQGMGMLAAKYLNNGDWTQSDASARAGYQQADQMLGTNNPTTAPAFMSDFQESAHGGTIDGRTGGPVPGTAKVQGNSYDNDKVNAKLSPGEEIIDRETLQDPGPIGQAARMVANHINSRNKMACGGMYAQGGKPDLPPPQFPTVEQGQDVKRSIGGHNEPAHDWQSAWQNIKDSIGTPQVQNKARGGMIRRFKDGGPEPFDDKDMRSINSSEHNDQALDKEIRDADVTGNYLSRPGVEKESPSMIDNLSNIYGQPDAGAMPMGNYVQTPNSNGPAPMAQPQQAQQGPQSVQDILANREYNKGLEQEVLGHKQQMQAQQNINREMGPQFDQLSKSSATADKMYLDNVANEDLHQKAIFKDWLDGKIPQIDANHYMNTMGTGGKIATAIGLILGGMGGGLTHQENPAMKFLQNQIDNDVKSQQANIDNKKTLMGALHQYYGDRNTALLAYQNFKYRQLDLGLKTAAAKSGNLEAQSNYNLAAGPIQQKIDQNNNQIGLQKFVMQQGQIGQNGQGQLSNQDPATLVNITARDKEDKKQILEEIKNRQNLSTNFPKMLDAFDRAANEQTVLRTGGGMLRESPALKELHQLMLPNFKTIDGTVRQAAMDESFHNIDPKPGDFNSSTKVKRDALVNWARSESAAPASMNAGLNLDNYAKTSLRMHPALADQVERLDPKTGKIGIFDAQSKKFLGYK